MIKNKVMILAAVVGTSVLSGCNLEKQYLDNCEANGIDRTACFEQYHADNRANADRYQRYQESSRKLDAKKQDAKQHAQAAKATHVYQYDGMKITLKNDVLDIDGTLAALDENEPKAKVYSQGLRKYIYYTNGKMAVLDTENRFLGWAKKVK